MAEIVGSALLSAFFSVLFDKLATEEVKNFLRPKKVVNKLLEKLEVLGWSADELLDDAEEKLIYNPRVENWHNKLKDVIYRASELADKIETEALRHELEGRQSASNITKMLTKLCSNPSKLCSKPLSSFENDVKDELEDIIPSLELLLSQKDSLGLVPAGTRRGNDSGVTPAERSRATPVAHESGFCGRQDIKETIIQSLRLADVRGEKFAVIPIIGAGGLGKTTLAQIIYRDSDVQKHFPDARAWVTVSTEFDLPAIIKKIIGQVSNSSQTDGKVDQQDLLFKLDDALKGKKFLLVLDDVWSEDHGEWNKLKSCFESGEPGSKIIVTTRNSRVASIAAPNQQLHFLPELPEEDCRRLFEKTVFSSDQDRQAHPDLQEIGKKIVEKCKGVPLSVKSVGGILRGNRDPEKWESILKSSVWELLQKSDKNIIPSLWLSYRYLPSHLKRCFAYCSIFPKDYFFEKKEIVRLWMAEGFLKNEAERTMEEVGKQYLEELISRSLFQRSSGGDEGTIMMHDLVHDLAMYVSGKFCFWLDKDKILRDLPRETRHLSYSFAIEDAKKFEGLSKAKGLHTFVGFEFSYQRQKLDILKVLEEFSVEGACLRVLSLSNYYQIRSLPDSVGNLKQLRYLNLSNTSVRELPHFVGTLYNLQTLLLSTCTDLTQLPESIGNLKQLRYLDLSYSDVRELPDSIGTLYNLQTLLLSGCRSLTRLPSNQGSLINMHHLDIRDSPKLEFLGNCHYGSLKNLKIVNCEALKSIPLDYFPKLNRFTLKELECLVELTGDSPDGLEELSITECPKLEFPGSSRYGSLIDLKIKNCEALKSIPLDYFPKLNRFTLEELGCLVELTGDSPDELEGLSIKQCPNLEFLWNGRFGSLKELEIAGCETLESIPLYYFPKLNELTLNWCGNFESFRFAEETPLVLESLTYLKLKGLPKFVSFPEGGLLAPNLKLLYITDCNNLRSLPQQMPRFLPSLDSLYVSDCGEIESSPEGGLPSNLKLLGIEGCKKLAAQVMHWDLQATCLKELVIDGCGEELLDSFPPEGLLPTSLTFLWIRNFQGLKTLNIHAFQHLEKLWVEECDELQCLPEESLPNSLVELIIRNCPLLERRYRKETGEGWHKISHIPDVWINGDFQH